MTKKNTRNTKGRIISAAWKLFYEQGYENTTVEDIVFDSQTSKGSFYHYFNGKDALLGTLANVFDEKYEELLETLDPESDAVGKLIYLNRELFAMIESGVSLELLTRLLSTSCWPKGKTPFGPQPGFTSACSGRLRPKDRKRASCAGTSGE